MEEVEHDEEKDDFTKEEEITSSFLLGPIEKLFTRKFWRYWKEIFAVLSIIVIIISFCIYAGTNDLTALSVGICYSFILVIVFGFAWYVNNRITL